MHVALGTDGFAMSASGQLHFGTTGPLVDVQLVGTIIGQDEFSATLTGSLSAPWVAPAGLSIASGALTASVSRAAGITPFDVVLGVAGDWQPVTGLALRQITARLSNRPAPPECAITAGVTWAELTGTARVEVGAPAPVIDLTVRACLGIDQPSLVLSSTASGQDLTLLSMCPAEAPKVGGQCLPDHKLNTSLRLMEFFLSIDTTGRFGFGGRAVLQLASSDGIAPASTLNVVVEASVDFTAPSFDLALYFEGDLVNALEIEGLALRDLGHPGWGQLRLRDPRPYPRRRSHRGRPPQ